MKVAFPSRYGLLVLLFVLAVSILLVFAARLTFGSSSDGSLVYRLAEWYRSLGMTGVFVSISVMVASALTFLPAEAPAIANGAVYGLSRGAMLSWASGMLGANIAFAIGRLSGPQFLGRILNETRLIQVEVWIRKRGGVSLLIARCIPLFPFFLLNYGAGIIGMRVWTYNWATALGLLPAAILFAILGEQMGRVTLAQGIFIAGIVLALIAFITYLVRLSPILQD